MVKAFIALKPGFQASRELKLDIMNFVRKKLSALAMPREIEFVPRLPKTRSLQDHAPGLARPGMRRRDRGHLDFGKRLKFKQFCCNKLPFMAY